METFSELLERLRALLADVAAGGPTQGEADRLVQRIGRSLGAFSDPGYRRAHLKETVEGMDDARLLALLAVSLKGAHAGRIRHRDILATLSMAPELLHELDYERRSVLYQAARACGLDEVANLFLSDRVHSNPSLEETFVGNQHLEAPLGARKGIARKWNRFLLDRAMHDRDVGVITLLLDNPRIVERDVVRIAAMRPTRPEILSVISRHRRWGSRSTVRFALAANPATPLTISRSLLPTLLRQQLIELLALPGLDPALREAIRVALDARSPS